MYTSVPASLSQWPGVATHCTMRMSTEVNVDIHDNNEHNCLWLVSPVSSLEIITFCQALVLVPNTSPRPSQNLVPISFNLMSVCSCHKLGFDNIILAQ